MQHTSPYKYRRLELYDKGSNSDYYVGTSTFSCLVHDSIVTGSISMIANEAKKVVALKDPHVIQNVVREEIDQLVTYHTIDELKLAVDFWLFNVAHPLYICENNEEVEASKIVPNVNVVYNVEKGTMWVKEVGQWFEKVISYDMKNEPWKTIGKRSAICFHPDTGKYFVTSDYFPWFQRWPTLTSGINVIWNPQEFNPSLGFGLLEVISNVSSNSKYRIEGDNGVDTEWIDSNIMLRLNPGNYRIFFNSLTGFGTPFHQDFTIEKDKTKTISCTYVILYNVTFTSNLYNAQVKLKEPSPDTLPSNIRECGNKWLPIHYKYTLPNGTYKFEFNENLNYWTPQELEVTIDKLGFHKYMKYDVKLTYGTLSIYEWKNLPRNNGRTSYGNITCIHWKTQPRIGEEVEYDASKVDVLPL